MGAHSRSPRSKDMLTGFISLEEGSFQPTTATTPMAWKRNHSMLGCLIQQKWVYGVLQRGTLRCYRRRVDIKHNRAPIRVLLLDLDATVVSGRQSLIIQSRATGMTMRLCVHPSSTSTYLQWVTALYLARLESSASSASPVCRKSRTDHAKRVTFNEQSEYIRTSESSTDDSIESTTSCASIDFQDLYYTQEDFDHFRQSWQNEIKPSHKVRSLVSIFQRRK